MDKGAEEIRLCQEQGKLEISKTEGVNYIGVNHPSASVPEQISEKEIVIQNVDIEIEETVFPLENI